MIVTIEGILAEKSPIRLTIENQGLGYEVLIPLSTYESLPPANENVRLFTHVAYKEDSQTLYGFATRSERDFFKLIVEKVSGIGPKIALSILSKLSLPILKKAIQQEDVNLLSKCPGIGKKTAERLILELKDKIEKSLMPNTPSLSDLNIPLDNTTDSIQEAVAAMISLGYKISEADKAVQKAQKKLGESATTESLLRTAISGK